VTKTAVMYGAGNIGRGFIGQLLSESGYEVVFVDIDDALVARLNSERAYPLRFVSNSGARELRVENVRAVRALDGAGVAKAIAEASVMATAVGAPALPSIGTAIGGGLSRRWADGNLVPLNILICENLAGAGGVLRTLVAAALDERERAFLDERVGFVETSIGRMVPVMSPEMQEGDPLRIWAEGYAKLPVDRDGFRGAIPDIRNMVPHRPFAFHLQRKLYIHNMGHALTAYLGQQRGYRLVAQAVADPDVLATCRAAMMESAQALAREHGVDLAQLVAHVEDLLERFGNRALGDTLDRVGRDLRRKLAPGDRLIGALGACLRNGVEPRAICTGVAAALRFRDPVAGPVSILLGERGPEAVLEDLCGIAPGSWAWERILEAYAAAAPLARTP
jgi:mannitol-1-phosphate 5-dehydrogenase